LATIYGGFGAAGVWSAHHDPAQGEVGAEKSGRQPSMSKVVRVVELELADGVEADRFERFALDEYLPAVASLGVTVTLLRGNRGERDRGFLLLEEFESVEHRNRLFPGSETPSVSAARWIETHQELVRAWNALIASAHMTDYEPRGGSPASTQPCS
jgi:hypothetical protein